jgi:hypothetical protein
MAPKSLGELIYYTLYLKNIEHRKDEIDLDPQIPHPNDVHRHLIALFQEHSSRVWISNYNDLCMTAPFILLSQPGQTKRYGCS